MNKKLIPVLLPVLLFLFGIMAVTQELAFFPPGAGEEEINDFYHEDSLPRWFRSNAGGMALEELHSRFAAVRNEYALSIASCRPDELPEYLVRHYVNNFKIELRALYKNGIQIRTQWLFRDNDGITRLNAVFPEPEKISNDPADKNMIRFIEIFDEKAFLLSEYRFFESGAINRADYVFNDNLLISADFLSGEDGENFEKIYSDFFRYNRSLSLRFIERIFFTGAQIQHEDSVLIAFPRRIMDIANQNLVIGERINLYPDFFGDTFVQADSRIIFETDARGRIITQTLYDDEEKIVWVIRNTWLDNRIVSTSKTEGDTVFLAEYEYNPGGDRVIERNLRNGVLERIVRAQGIFDIEELYLDNVVVLRAVWEDGRKISETRVRD